jgi:hypothetical protein
MIISKSSERDSMLDGRDYDLDSFAIKVLVALLEIEVEEIPQINRVTGESN